MCTLGSDASSRYEKELQFGAVMLKRANRELTRLETEMAKAVQLGEDANALRAQRDQLSQAICLFEEEWQGFQAREKCAHQEVM